MTSTPRAGPQPEGGLEDRLLETIHAGAGSPPLADARFGELALELFRHQFTHNAPYRAFCERRGSTPGTVESWAEIPAVPTRAFRLARLVCGDRPPQAVFRTSGTTAGEDERGAHEYPDLTLYDAALIAGFQAHLLADGAAPMVIALVPSPAELPDSSLSHMAGRVVERLGAAGSGFFMERGVLNVEAVVRACGQAAEAGIPVCIFATSLALHELLVRVAGAAAPALPPGSRVMDTGGSKLRDGELPSPRELRRQIGERLGVPATHCVNEYGMTELSSQLYDHVAGAPEPARRLHRAPPWMRSAARDPDTLRILPEGERGILCHWDLANLHSVAAVQTEDLGVVGAGGVELLGRLRGAVPRGCSLAAEEMVAAAVPQARGS
jgi:hypothetical protein